MGTTYGPHVGQQKSTASHEASAIARGFADFAFDFPFADAFGLGGSSVCGDGNLYG